MLLAGCATLAPRPELPHQAAVPVGAVTPLDELIGDAEARHPAQSGFRLVAEGPEAFAIRARTAATAARSIDVQTYIWHDDMTGLYLAHVLLEAADRGVRVRVLVDDMDARGKTFGFAALDAHPNIEVRMFNPFAQRDGIVGFALEALGSFRRINRRMHNKSWIVDNRIAIVGGRNLGDEYFGASEDVNFVDLDFAMIGPIVREASGSFDRYWNASPAYPVALLAPESVSAESLATLRAGLARRVDDARASRFARELEASEPVQRLLAGDWPMSWSAEYRFVADDPLKVLGESSGVDGSDVLAQIAPLARDARERVFGISPYFVPGPGATEVLVDLARSGRDVRVLTNSLAANDVAAVYGGYVRYRKRLLEGGVKLWELKPATGAQVDSSFFGSSGASLHTKALLVDGTTVFVGSFNLDPRSTSLNCEQGIIVESPVIAGQLERIFAMHVAGERAWEVGLENGRVRWYDGVEVETRTPEASFSRKLQAWLARVLPLESQL
jgi:putative cardiolipin synthase